MYSYIPGILSVLLYPARVILLVTCYWMEETENQTSGSNNNNNNNNSSSRSPPCSSPSLLSGLDTSCGIKLIHVTDDD